MRERIRNGLVEKAGFDKEEFSDSKTWFIYTRKSGQTKRLIATALSAIKFGNNEPTTVLCSDGKRRPLWQCPDQGFVQSFQKMAVHNRYRYDIYVRDNEGSPVRLYKPAKLQPHALHASRLKMVSKHA
jgi:hypothetical protein